jgi:hypothetical protein
MINFYSESINDEQTRRSAHLIAAIVANALRELMIRPSELEGQMRTNINPAAAKSVVFFNSNVFIAYCHLIGIDHNQFLERLKYGTNLSAGKRITDMDFRAIRQRMSWKVSDKALMQRDDDLVDIIMKKPHGLKKDKLKVKIGESNTDGDTNGNQEEKPRRADYPFWEPCAQ